MSDSYTVVEISTPYITLSQCIKMLNIFDSGGMIKHIIQHDGVYVNGELEHRRGRKLYPNDVITIKEFGSIKIQKNE